MSHEIYGLWSVGLCLLCLWAQRTRQASKRLICSVATEPAPKQAEEPKMEAPKEIFLKDYKLPDYYFDAVKLA